MINLQNNYVKDKETLKTLKNTISAKNPNFVKKSTFTTFNKKIYINT
jgi:hypothetical protein